MAGETAAERADDSAASTGDIPPAKCDVDGRMFLRLPGGEPRRRTDPVPAVSVRQTVGLPERLPGPPANGIGRVVRGAGWAMATAVITGGSLLLNQMLFTDGEFDSWIGSQLAPVSVAKDDGAGSVPGLSAETDPPRTVPGPGGSAGPAGPEGLEPAPGPVAAVAVPPADAGTPALRTAPSGGSDDSDHDAHDSSGHGSGGSGGPDDSDHDAHDSSGHGSGGSGGPDDSDHDADDSSGHGSGGSGGSDDSDSSGHGSG